jgi:acetolactate synthase-1/2/3 large subunit
MGNTMGGEGTFQQRWESYSPDWAAVARAYGVDAVKIQSAAEFADALKMAVDSVKNGKPFLIDAPMENIAVPTPGIWNINDIYTHKDNVDIENGRLKFADEMGGKAATVVRTQAADA